MVMWGVEMMGGVKEVPRALAGCCCPERASGDSS